jgi:hypothetical protein
MTPVRPPTLALWLLDHLCHGPAKEALAGNLLEEFSAGGTAAWHWRQILAVFALACSRPWFNHRGVLFLITLWFTLAPAWLPGRAALKNHPCLNRRFMLRGALFVPPKVFLLGCAHPLVSAIDSWIDNRHLAALLVRLPFLLTVLCTLGGAAGDCSAHHPARHSGLTA